MSKAIPEGTLVQIVSTHAYRGCLGVAGASCGEQQSVSLIGGDQACTITALPTELRVVGDEGPPLTLATPRQAVARVRAAGAVAAMRACLVAGDEVAAAAYADKVAQIERWGDAP